MQGLCCSGAVGDILGDPRALSEGREGGSCHLKCCLKQSPKTPTPASLWPSAPQPQHPPITKLPHSEHPLVPSSPQSRASPTRITPISQHAPIPTPPCLVSPT